MTERCSTDVLICGAGASGLALAIDLARRGLRVRLIDRANEPFRGSRGKGIQPRTQEIFEDLGILDRLVALGGIYPPLRKYRPDGSYVESTMGEIRAPTPAEPYRVPLMVPQFLTERVMRERLPELGGAVEFGCELVGFEQDDEGVDAHLVSPRGEERVRARYLIGADGGRSFVRQALAIGFPGKTLGMRAMVADVVLTRGSTAMRGIRSVVNRRASRSPCAPWQAQICFRSRHRFRLKARSIFPLAGLQRWLPIARAERTFASSRCPGRPHTA